LAHEPWPAYDDSLVHDETIEIGVQVNGRLRGRITLEREASEENAMKLALQEKNVASHVGDKTPKKIIYKPGQILNIIVGK
jgi:leucyl-tRNA synthetase